MSARQFDIKLKLETFRNKIKIEQQSYGEGGRFSTRNYKQLGYKEKTEFKAKLFTLLEQIVYFILFKKQMFFCWLLFLL